MVASLVPLSIGTFFLTQQLILNQTRFSSVPAIMLLKFAPALTWSILRNDRNRAILCLAVSGALLILPLGFTQALVYLSGYFSWEIWVLTAMELLLPAAMLGAAGFVLFRIEPEPSTNVRFARKTTKRKASP